MQIKGLSQVRQPASSAPRAQGSTLGGVQSSTRGSRGGPRHRGNGRNRPFVSAESRLRQIQPTDSRVQAWRDVTGLREETVNPNLVREHFDWAEEVERDEERRGRRR